MSKYSLLIFSWHSFVSDTLLSPGSEKTGDKQTQPHTVKCGLQNIVLPPREVLKLVWHCTLHMFPHLRVVIRIWKVFCLSSYVLSFFHTRESFFLSYIMLQSTNHQVLHSGVTIEGLITYPEYKNQLVRVTWVQMKDKLIGERKKEKWGRVEGSVEWQALWTYVGRNNILEKIM